MKLNMVVIGDVVVVAQAGAVGRVHTVAQVVAQVPALVDVKVLATNHAADHVVVAVAATGNL